MLLVLICFFTMLAMLDWAVRLGRVELLILRTRHKLFELRDLLRDAAIWGDVNPNTLVFDYLDSSLTWRAASLKDVTVYHIAGVLLSRSDDERQLTRRDLQTVFVELNKPENSRLKKIYEAYQDHVDEFIHARHRFSLTLFNLGVSLWAQTHRKPPQEFKTELRIQGLRVVTSDPDFSESQHLCS
jgi:hypothetical protein